LRNLTVGPPTRLILLFSLPLLLGNLFQQFYIFVDSAVVGRIIGQDGLAAVGLTGRMVFLIIGFSWGATAGFAIPVAKAFGAKDYVQVKRNIASSAIVACFVIVAITAAGLYFGDSLLRLINTPVELFTMASEYQAIMFGTAVFTVGFNWLAATIRALGDSKTPLYFLIASNILNAVFSYIAVGPMGMGVAGSAWGTAAAQLITIVACVWYAKRKMPEMFPTISDFKEGIHELSIPARSGLPMGFQMSVIGLGTVILGAAINGLGTEAVAASTVAGRLEGLTMAPLNTFGVAMTTYVAQNYGAKQYARIRTGVFRMVIVSVIVAFTLGTLQLVFVDYLVRLFTTDPSAQVVSFVHTHFQISLFMYFTLGILFIVRNTIQGLGAAMVPTIAGFAELGLRSAGAIVLAGTLGLGWVGVVWANPLAWAGAMVMCGISYLFHRKRLVRLERGEITENDVVDFGFPHDDVAHDGETPARSPFRLGRGSKLEVGLAS
jgi:putative MATE family efflux protein